MKSSGTNENFQKEQFHLKDPETGYIFNTRNVFYIIILQVFRQSLQFPSLKEQCSEETPEFSKFKNNIEIGITNALWNVNQLFA